MSSDVKESVSAASQPAEKDQSNGLPEKNSRPKKPLPTNRIAIQKQYDLLRAFGAVSGPDGNAVTNVQVSRIAGLHAATVGLAVPFFTESGLLQKTNDGLIPAPEVREFTAAYEWNPQTAFRQAAPLLEGTWFFQRLLPKLRYRPLSRSDAIQELAQEAHAGPSYRGQLETILEYLDAAGLVAIEGDSVRLAQSTANGQADADPKACSEPSSKPEAPARHSSPVATTFTGPTAGVVQFNISVKVDMTEFAGWSPERISAFFSGVAQVLAAKGTVEEKASSLTP